MKKIIYIWLILTILASVPVIASCPLTGACSPINYPDYSQQAIQNQTIQNNINNIENRIQESQQQINNNTLQIDNELNNPETSQQQLPSTEPYNASCQFGTCLP